MNILLEIKSGSHLYGTNTIDSDLDYLGICVPETKYILGLKTINEIDLSIKSKDINGKNNKDAIDRKFYDLRNYLKLAIDNNPNILEILFCNKSNIININNHGNQLISIRKEFLHKGLYNRFIGYAISQKNKMIIKKDMFFNMEDAVKYLSKLDNTLLLPQLHGDSEFRKYFFYNKETDLHYKVGDMIIVKNQTVKRAIQEIEKRIGEKTNRKELILSKGYDYKYSSHLIRLLLEGKELLDTYDLNFPLKDKDLIIDIKKGNWSLEDVLKYSESLEEELKISLENTFLPDKPNIELIEEYLINTLKYYI